MLKRAALLTIILLLQTFIAVSWSSAETAERKFSLTPFVGGYTFDNSQELDTDIVYGLRLGYVLDRNWEVEGVFDYVSTASETGLGDADAYNYRVDGIYNIPMGDRFVPFLAAGAGGNTVDYPDSARGTKTRAALNYGGGLKYFVSDALAVRGDLRHILVLEKMDRAIGNFEYTVGLSYYIGQAAPAPEEKDSDNDGVMDGRDRCPDTPKGVSVDTNGCPLDSDGDGVADYLDRCPDTPKGVAVDVNGCPLDSDGDGVADYLDRCPNTPKGVPVDVNGCPLDSDGDGVADYLDRCPNTPKGVSVDANGCPPMLENRSMRLNIEFDTDKADIKPQYFDEIKKVADLMNAYPDISVAIEGHTDDVGSIEYNEKLSSMRAGSVKSYLVENFGISAERLSATGFGPSRPIAENTTPEGRQKNRRIEAVINYTVEK